MDIRDVMAIIGCVTGLISLLWNILQRLQKPHCKIVVKNAFLSKTNDLRIGDNTFAFSIQITITNKSSTPQSLDDIRFSLPNGHKLIKRRLIWFLPVPSVLIGSEFNRRFCINSSEDAVFYLFHGEQKERCMLPIMILPSDSVNGTIDGSAKLKIPLESSKYIKSQFTERTSYLRAQLSTTFILEFAHGTVKKKTSVIAAGRIAQ